VGAVALLFVLSNSSTGVIGQKLEFGACICIDAKASIYVDGCGAAVAKTDVEACFHFAGQVEVCGTSKRYVVKFNFGFEAHMRMLLEIPWLRKALDCEKGPNSCPHDQILVDEKDLHQGEKGQCKGKEKPGENKQRKKKGKEDGKKGKNKQGKKKAKGDGNKDCKPDGHMKVEYTVKPGDTLTAIAKKFGVSVKQIVRDNHIKYPDIIFVGQQLCINKAKKANP
jgi:hypothetical protein